MRRAMWVVAAVALVVVGGSRARGAGVIDPTSVATNTDAAFNLSPGDTSTVTDVTLTVPAGFLVLGCGSSTQFTCHQTGTDATQDTTVQWLRNAGTDGQPQPEGRFAFNAHSPNNPGDYTFTIATNDSVNGAKTFEPTVKVTGAAVTTTSTTRPTTTTSSTSTTTVATTTTITTEPTASTTSTIVATVRRSGSNDSDRDEDASNAGPLAVAVVALGAVSIGTVVAVRRARRPAA